MWLPNFVFYMMCVSKCKKYPSLGGLGVLTIFAWMLDGMISWIRTHGALNHLMMHDTCKFGGHGMSGSVVKTCLKKPGPGLKPDSGVWTPQCVGIQWVTAGTQVSTWALLV